MDRFGRQVRSQGNSPTGEGGRIDPPEQHVGVGHATGEKEETTLAANKPDLLDEPLDRKWLERARRSTSAEPLHEPKYRQAPLSPETWAKLQAHPQFQ
mgnify:CR=1 FL=1